MKNNIEFQIAHIRVEEYTTFIENLNRATEEFRVSSGFGVSIDFEQKSVRVKFDMDLVNTVTLQPIITTIVECAYKIDENSWDDFLKLNLKTSKDLLYILANKTVDTTRGIISEKLRYTSFDVLYVPVLPVNKADLSILHKSIREIIKHESTLNSTAVG